MYNLMIFVRSPDQVELVEFKKKTWYMVKNVV